MAKHLVYILVILTPIFIILFILRNDTTPKMMLSRFYFNAQFSYVSTLKYREVHLWCLFPDEVQASDLSLYRNIISHEEKTHLMDIVKHKAKEYLLTRVLARTLLAKCIETIFRQLNIC